MKTLFRSLLALTALTVVVATGSAQLVVFNMNDMSGGATSATENQLLGIPTLTLAGGSLVVAGQEGTAFTDASGTLHAAGLAAAWSSGINDAPANTLLLTLNTTGYKDFVIRYDYRSTSTGSPSALFEYRIGGSGGFTTIQTDTYTRDSTFRVLAADLATLDAIEDASLVELRWTLAAGTSTGTMRVDNLQLTGVVIPEPSSVMLVGAGLAGLLALCRRK